jgi:hypothetical protein
MRKLRSLAGIIGVVAICAVGAATASAAQFTASATGTLVGHALENQVLTTNGGEVVCSKAAAEGAIISTASAEQEVTVNYSGCTAFGFANVDVSPEKYLFTAFGPVHIKNSVTITPTLFGASLCTTTVPPQTVSAVAFANSGLANIKEVPFVTGITYTSTGGACGLAGANGTLKGAIEWTRSGGGTLRFDV